MKNINNLQLRSSRHVLNLGIRDIANLLKISKSSVNNAELGKTRDFFFKHSAPLIDFFLSKKIIFPNEYSIRMDHEELKEQENYNKGILTRFQLKASRTLISISQHDLAKTLGIDKNIISRLERKDNKEMILKVININNDIKEVFLSHGIEFPDSFSIFFKKFMDRELNN